jgi:4-hydroxyacetophenone monooxygenase
LDEDVRVITDPIAQFNENGIQLSDGKDLEFDVIICATGFDVAFAPLL